MKVLLFLAALLATSHASGANNRVVEFYNKTLDHYFITANAAEAASVDSGGSGPGWARTGNFFYEGGSARACRFYGSITPGPNSHFYTASDSECAALKALAATTPVTQKRWNYEGVDFMIDATSNAACPASTTPVWRAYNNGFARGIDSNHRITTSLAAIREVVDRGWIDEGIVMCAPLPVTLHYADKVYALWTDGYPFAVAKTGADRVVNRTRFAGGAPFINCWLAEQPLADGRILASCLERVSLVRYVFYIDPTSAEMRDYADPMPDAVVWLDQSPYDPVRPEYKARVPVSDGWFFTTDDAQWVLKFEAASTGVVSVVRAGTSDVDGKVSLLVAYRN